MWLNSQTAICTNKVLLVPYEAHHVDVYHEWMKSPELQELTASEPLSIDEEYSMQKSWRNDIDKLTFIICTPPTQHEKQKPMERRRIIAGEEDNADSMAGDVNLFLSLAYEESPDGEEDTSKPFVAGELELMVARPDLRGKGMGKAALLAFVRYIKRHEKDIIRTFLSGVELQRPDSSGLDRATTEERCLDQGISLGVKIADSNTTSKGLFESIGFKVVGEINYFGEVELKLSNDKSFDICEGWSECSYAGSTNSGQDLARALLQNAISQ